jgi:hypothetical protein
VTFSVVASGTAPLSYQWYQGVTPLPGATAASFLIASAQAANAGSYACVVTNSAGSVTSAAATLVVNAALTAPVIVTSPASATVAAGEAATFTVVASGTAPLNYQWRKNGADIFGATAATYVIATVQSTDAATYACVVTNAAGSATSGGAVLTVTVRAAGPAARIVNLAVRARVGGAAGAPTVGFVLSGAGAGKRLLVRAVGPTLTGFGVAGALANPRLQLFSAGTVLATNDDWLAADAPAFAAVGAFPLAAGSADAAIVSTLPPAAYTTPVGFPAGTSGVVLIECYDGAPADITTRLINASALATVGTGDDVLIPGFVISGEGTVRILLRAVGPTLAAFGVPGTLADPQVTLFRDGVNIGSNNDWDAVAGAAEVAAAAASVGAFALNNSSRDAAVLVSLTAGAYTATVSGVGAATGTALVEVYIVP